MKRKVMRVVLSIGRRGNMCFLEEWYSNLFCSHIPRCNFSSTLYSQSCWCII
jgi:hypothetical protein